MLFHSKVKPRKKMVKNSSKNEKMKMVQDNRPCFFKIISDGCTAQHLRIPPEFVKYVLNDVSKTAVLKGPSGERWNLKLCTNANNVIYLKDGWQKFLRDHSLGNNEFLLFRYDGNMCFNVQIFDQNGCVRVYGSTIRTHPESAFSESKRQLGRPRKYPVGSLNIHQSKRSKDDPGQSQRKTRREEIDLVKEMDSQHKAGQKGTKRKRKTETTELPSTPEPNSRTGRRLSRQQPPNERGRAKIWKAAESFTSKFPYFKILLRESNVKKVFQLPIPSSFAKAYFPECKTKMILRNSAGKYWEVMYIPYVSCRVLSKGWPAFVHFNKLRIGDICMFELVSENEMQVHIFR